MEWRRRARPQAPAPVQSAVVPVVLALPRVGVLHALFVVLASLRFVGVRNGVVVELVRYQRFIGA